MMGIVHHSVYPIWYEAARTDFIKLFGMTYSQMEKSGILLPVVEVTSKYIGSARYEDELDVTAQVKRLTPARIEFYYEVFRKGEEKPLNTGTTTHAWVDSNFRVMNMKKTHPDLFEKLSASVEE